jgi:plasmid stabilization system protein ParE
VARIVWPKYVLEVLDELPLRDAELIVEKTKVLVRFPRLYPVRPKGRFRRHRWLLAGRWIVYYRVTDETVFIRALWPAQIP